MSKIIVYENKYEISLYGGESYIVSEKIKNLIQKLTLEGVKDWVEIDNGRVLIRSSDVRIFKKLVSSTPKEQWKREQNQRDEDIQRDKNSEFIESWKNKNPEKFLELKKEIEIKNRKEFVKSALNLVILSFQ